MRPALPSWWAKARPLVGITLALLLVTVVALRALGVIGTAAPEPTAVGTAPLPKSTQLPSPAPASVEPQVRLRTAPQKPRTAGPRARDQRPVEVDPDLIADVEDVLGRERQRSRPEPEPEPEPEPAVFTVSSFNVLGHSHTTARGNKPQYAEGPTRMRWATQLLQGFDIDVVGFQEFELVQLNAFRQLTGGRFDVYPGGALGRNAVRNSIAWRLDTWDLVRADTVPIPYFRGNRVPMPYVLLEHVPSGQRVFFINVHNPASVKGRGYNEPWRDLGTRLEIDLVERLRALTGLPVVLMGDFNERAEVFCKVTGRGGMVAANGGSAAPCRPPADHGIDWIFGTEDISFSDYVRTRSGLVARTTDHPIIVSKAQVH